MSTRPRSGTIAFQPRARLLKLLGEELISDEVVALGELVKNAHDADAGEVRVTFRGVTAPGGSIEVRDDGTGMDADTLLGRWMAPAASTKVGRGRQVTPRGRRVLGEKGVGRFAADKLARHLELFSRCPGRADEVCAAVDWDQYDTDDLALSEVLNRWELRRAAAVEPHGTLLRMSGLRSVWTERMFRRLSIRLARLLSPFHRTDPLVIRIESDEFPQYAGELRADFLEKAPYRVEACFDGRQTIDTSLNGRRAASQRWNGQGELCCGPVKVRLYVFDLDGEAIARVGPRVEVRAWLREWTGVSIYRDGYRVWPYGEPHDDWLRLDQRRVNSPVEHLSNNQVIGFIDIGRDANPELTDQTNREGLFHNQAFDDLRRLVYFALQAVEAERQSIRHPVRRVVPPAPAENGAPTLAADLGRLAAKATGELGEELRRLQRRAQEDAAREREDQQRMLAGYSGLAALGQMASGLLPLLPVETARLQTELERLRAIIANRKLPEAREALQNMSDSMASINEQHRVMLAATGAVDRRRTIDLAAEVKSYREFVQTLLETHGVEMLVTCPPDTEVLRTEMRPENFYSLLQILTSNALDWLRRTDGPQIRVTVRADEERCELVFSDNGPGVPLEAVGRVFDPMFSRKEGGRGMGLTVARQVVESHGGRIELLVDGRRRGANFRLVFPRKRSRATLYNSA